jgi:predicted Rdx family selenoprotein
MIQLTVWGSPSIPRAYPNLFLLPSEGLLQVGDLPNTADLFETQLAHLLATGRKQDGGEEGTEEKGQRRRERQSACREFAAGKETTASLARDLS